MIRCRRIFSVVTLGLLLAPTAVFAEDQEVSTIEVIPNLGMREQIVRQIVPQIEAIRGGWDFQAIVTNADDARVTDTKVTLRWKVDGKDKQEELTTNAKGQAAFQLTTERLDGLVLDIPKECKVKFTQGDGAKVFFGQFGLEPAKEDDDE